MTVHLYDHCPVFVSLKSAFPVCPIVLVIEMSIVTNMYACIWEIK